MPPQLRSLKCDTDKSPDPISRPYRAFSAHCAPESFTLVEGIETEFN